MAENINQNLLTALASLSLDEEVLMFQLSNYDLDSPNDTFCFSNVTGVAFGGINYQPLACKLDNFEYKNEGTNEPTITVADPFNVIGQYSYLQGATVRILVTQKRFLDGSDDSDPTAIKYDESYQIQHKSEHVPGQYITFVVSGIFDYRDEIIGRLCSRKCSYIYKDPNTCAYNLSNGMYTFDNKRTLDPAKDRCGKTVTSCKVRGNLQRFAGFPYTGLY